MALPERPGERRPIGSLSPARQGEHVLTDFEIFHRPRLEVHDGNTVNRRNGHIVVRLIPDRQDPDDMSVSTHEGSVVLYPRSIPTHEAGGLLRRVARSLRMQRSR